MKLYQHPAAVNPRRVRMFLAEKGILGEVELITVDLGKGEHREAAFLKKNPYAALPVLELDDGTHISESISISRYFENENPDNALFGKGPKEEAIIDMWQRRIESSVLSPVGTYFHQATNGLGEVDKYRNKEWGEYNLTLLGEALDKVESQLNKNLYIAGREFSIADITLVTSIDFGRKLGIIDIGDYPSLKNWYKSVSARSSAAA